MKWRTKSGRLKEIPVANYRVDWDGDQGSKFSEDVLDLLYPYWKHDVVLAELPVAGTKMRYDFVNLTKKVIVETDGIQHDKMSNHFHRGSRLVFGAQIQRDLDKDDLAYKNGFTMVRIKPDDLPALEKDIKGWFAKHYNILL